MGVPKRARRWKRRIQPRDNLPVHNQCAILTGFAQRLTRARDNCFETLPLFAALAVGAHITGRLDVTDPLAMWVLYFRLAQSVTHLASTSVPAVTIRANLFFLQIFIYGWWTIRLLA